MNETPQVAVGPPIGIKTKVFNEANKLCAKNGKAVETLKPDETNTGPAKSSAVSLQFKCGPEMNCRQGS